MESLLGGGVLLPFLRFHSGQAGGQEHVPSAAMKSRLVVGGP